MGKPILEPEQNEDGPGWHVRIVWDDGSSLTTYDCNSEAEAQAWIDFESDEWLLKHPKGSGTLP